MNCGAGHIKYDSERSFGGWRRRGLLLVAFLALSLPVRAQLGINLEADRNVYVRYEPVKLTLVLRNYSGHELDFGGLAQDSGEVVVVVSRSDIMGVEVKHLAQELGEFELGAGETRRLEFTLNRLVNMQPVTDYTVYAQVKHPDLGSDYRSAQVQVEVREGTAIWQRQTGVPGGDRDGVRAVRKVSMVRLHETKQDTYCLRIEDDKTVYRVVRLGPYIYGGEPQVDLDAAANTHVLMRSKARLYSHRVYDFNGRLKQEKYYIVEDGQPLLIRDDDTGRIGVSGGRPAVAGVDYTTPEPR